MDTSLLFLLAYLLLIIGFIGTLLPMLPGTILIWLGIVVWAWADGFHRIGWLTLGLMTLLFIIDLVSGFFLTTTFTRKSGASWKAIIASIVFGLLGGIVLSGLPVIGTLFGALLGALIGMFIVEWLDKRAWRRALGVSVSYLVGAITSKIVEISIGLLMLGIFVWQAFL